MDTKKNNTPDIKALYEEVRALCNDEDRNKYDEYSSNVIKAHSSNKLDRNDYSHWLSYSAQLAASLLALDIFQKKIHMADAELDETLNFFWNYGLPGGIAEYGILACARHLESLDPVRTHDLIMAVFNESPDIAKIMGKDYVYNPDKQILTETEDCPFCGAKGIPFYCSPQYLKLSGSSPFPPAKLWMKCPQCHNYYTRFFPLSKIDEVNGHYTDGNATVPTLKAHFSLSTYRDIFSHLKELSPGNKYFEVGIGNGEMLALAMEYGFDVSAIEICREDQEKVSSVLEIDVIHGDIVTYHTESKYDVIVLGDVLEHVTDPVNVLLNVLNMLTDRGILWISTPNYNCAYARMEKFDHAMWHEKNHYTYMSYETLIALMDTLGAKPIRYDISSRYTGSMEVIFSRK